jgi:hypothetical protein
MWGLRFFAEDAAFITLIIQKKFDQETIIAKNHIILSIIGNEEAEVNYAY